MRETLYDVDLWCSHAAEARALSQAIADPQTRQQMLIVAAGFDRIAQLAGQLVSVSEQRNMQRPASVIRAL